jgi:gamma-glutamyltranspeptidase / glutathione hydrolase
MNSQETPRTVGFMGWCFLLLICCSAIALPLAAGGQVTAKTAAISTASPTATRVGLNVLQDQRTAADAAVAVAFALAAVQPQAGNLGGGGFLVYYDAATRSVWTLDFREVAPRAITRESFAKMPESDRSGAVAAGVPATVAGLEALHAKFGSKPWKDLLEPAVLLAREGFVVDASLASDLARARRDRDLHLFPDAEAGKALIQGELAATLQRLATAGARDFYDGDLAKKIVAGVQKSGGLIGHRDLRDYQPVWRAPVKLRYGDFDLYTAPPPAGGALIIGAALNMIGGDDLPAMGFQTPASLHLIIEAQRRAFIDGNRYTGDPAAARIPFRDILSPARGEQWRKTILADRVIGTANLTAPMSGAMPGEHTTHFTIADAMGNVVSLTTGLGDDFGSGVFAPGLGFLLNTAMRDFTTGSNAPDAAKRPASPMSPVIILRDDKPYLALGSAGGNSIPTTILQVFLNVASYGRTLSEAVAAPRFHHAADPDEMLYESGLAPHATIDALNAFGHGVSGRDRLGDVHAILFDGESIVAVADPRRGGAAGGF